MGLFNLVESLLAGAQLATTCAATPGVDGIPVEFE